MFKKSILGSHFLNGFTLFGSIRLFSRKRAPHSHFFLVFSIRSFIALFLRNHNTQRKNNKNDKNKKNKKHKKNKKKLINKMKHIGGHGTCQLPQLTPTLFLPVSCPSDRLTPSSFVKKKKKKKKKKRSTFFVWKTHIKPKMSSYKAKKKIKKTSIYSGLH